MAFFRQQLTRSMPTIRLFSQLENIKSDFRNIFLNRCAHNQKECEEDSKPKCSKVSSSNKSCDPSKKKVKKSIPKPPFKSMWANPKCCVKVCSETNERFDELFYKPSDKNKRPYYRTWNKCPKVLIRPKKVCCPVKEDPPAKRKPSKRPCTATTCLTGPCPKISMPGCAKARAIPKCKVQRKITCRRVPTPFPSFSTCLRPKSNRKRPIECPCLNVPAVCDAYRALRRRGSK